MKIKIYTSYNEINTRSSWKWSENIERAHVRIKVNGERMAGWKKLNNEMITTKWKEYEKIWKNRYNRINIKQEK